MWFSRILQLLAAGRPEPLTLTGDSAGPAFRGRYLHVNGRPLALGRLIGQGDEALVYELVDLREGICTNVVKICRYAPETARYRRWAVEVRDERSPYAKLPDVERRPALLCDVPGGMVKIQPYLAADLGTAWTTPFPALPIYRSTRQFGVEYAMSLADVLLAKHGPRGVLLEAKAVCLWQADRPADAAQVMEEAVLALTAERSTSRFAATCRLAQMLLETYHRQPFQGSGIELDLGDGGPVIRNQYFATPEEAAADDTAQDRPTMLLLEVLAEEPYLVNALSLLASAISDAPAGPAMWAVLHAIERIDAEAEELPGLREFATERFGPSDAEPWPAQRPDDEPPFEPPVEAQDRMARFNDAYRPDPARAHQASGRHLAARSYLADGRPADAERELRTAVALDSRTLEYRLALTRLLSGDPARLDEARAIAEQTVADFPDEPDAYEALGAICVGLGELRDGLLAFLRALRCEPTEPWRVEVKVGQTFRDLGEHKRALPFLRAAYERAPEQSMTAVALAQSIRAWSEDEHPLRSPTFREAFGILTSSLRVNPDAADVLVCLAQSEAALHHPHRVRSLLRRALEDDPQHPFAGNFLGAVEDWLANRPPRRRPAPAGTSSVIRTSASIRPIR